MSKHKKSKRIHSVEEALQHERRASSIDAIMGFTNASDPREIKVEEKAVTLREAWAELETAHARALQA